MSMFFEVDWLLVNDCLHVERMHSSYIINQSQLLFLLKPEHVELII
jgi:hypothetical protein